MKQWASNIYKFHIFYAVSCLAFNDIALSLFVSGICNTYEIRRTNAFINRIARCARSYTSVASLKPHLLKDNVINYLL